MRIEDLNWHDVENYLQKDDRLMFVFGSCEQHGYLSVLTDVKIPLALADAASKKTEVLIAPPVNYGSSPFFLAYPGTFSLKVSTILGIIEDLVRSAYGQGFRRILILNGHGGNIPMRARLYELVNEMQDLRIAWYNWWESNSVLQLLEKYELKGSHASWIEAFPFTQVTELPEGEKVPPFIPGLTGAEETRQILGDGSFGGAYKVDDSVMQEIFSAALEDVVQKLQFEESQKE